MPDALEMPIAPTLLTPEIPGISIHLPFGRSITCLAGDIIGDYSFKEPLNPVIKSPFYDIKGYLHHC